MSEPADSEKETVSILIPCYNDAAYVGDAIESALGQTWPNCEVIVVDDGSDDESLSVARRYVSEGVQVIAQENQGASVARNRGLEVSTGSYIQYLDADDLLHRRKIEAQVSALKKASPETVAVCSTAYFQDGMPPEDAHWAKGEEQVPWLTDDDPVRWLVNLWTPDKGWGMVQPGAWLVPRAVMEDAGPWDKRLSRDDDGEYFTRVLLSSNRVQYVEDGCVYYRQHTGERVSGLHSREKFESWLLAVDLKLDHLSAELEGDRYPGLARGLARQYWSVALSAYPEFPEIAVKAERRAGDLGFPEMLRSVSENGWKGWIAKTISHTIGWRPARHLQWAYHRTRENFPTQLA